MEPGAENEPFLAAHPDSPTRGLHDELEFEDNVKPHRTLYDTKPHPRRRLYMALAGAALLVIALAVGLVSMGVHLEVMSALGSSSNSGSDKDASSNNHHASGSTPSATSTGVPVASSVTSSSPSATNTNVVYYHEDIPKTAKQRSMDEYIIDPSWKYDAEPVVREYFWTIKDAELNPDGVFRPMILINNQLPGPMVEVNEGDNVVVHIDNQAINATSMHFHGMFQNGTNAMDGTVGVTQCPIAPGSSYTYNFTVSGQSGTYWYHAHQSGQASDGLFGPMVVHTANERTKLQQLKYASDRVIMVHDHYRRTTSELVMEYLAPGRENEEPVPESAMINGRGMRECPASLGTKCDNSTQTFPEFALTRGEKHRLRIINTGAFATFQLQIDEHPFYITEVDGTDVVPLDFHRLEVMPAQRYSLIVDANSTTGDAFWLRGRFVTHCFRYKNPDMKANIEGIIRYVDAPANTTTESPSAEREEPTTTTAKLAEPTSADWSESIELVCKDMNASLLHPVVQQPIPKRDDYINIKAAFHIGPYRLSRGSFNETSWQGNHSSPSLHRVLDTPVPQRVLPGHTVINGVNSQLFDTKKEFVFQTSGVQTLDIAINNFDDGAHPFHLHGHRFWVLSGSEKGYPPKTTEELDSFLERTNALENPVLRDTVTVQSFRWVLIRVTLDNPGMWAFHCHNLWHAESGMFMQFMVMPEQLMLKSGVGSEERDLCTRAGIEKGLRPSDKVWYVKPY